jgi:hypothetical protein
VLDLYDEFKSIIAALHEESIEYAVCGGLAMAVHGFLRATVDIDLLIRPEDFPGVRSAVDGLGYKIDANPMTFAKGAVNIRRVSKLDPNDGDLLVLDLLLLTPESEAAWQSRVKAEWEGVLLSVVSREGLIALKSLRRSAVDLEDIERLGGES